MSTDDFFREAHAEIEDGISYSRVWVAYVEDQDRFYLVADGRDLALQTPPALHPHLAELTAEPDDRLGCHAGFLPWPPERQP